MSERRLLISFSGGETSALMTKLCRERLANQYDKISIVFANTGEENEETLQFINRCDDEWKLGVTWIEAEVDPEAGKGVRDRVVDFHTASRDGRPFEDVIKKYGIPNKAMPGCTKVLKGRPITSYARRRLGWLPRSYDLAIGIRVDEFDRMSENAKDLRIIYPMISPFPHRKIDVNEYWVENGWRLNLKGYQGNCKWCWKKSLRKHLTIITETPSAYDFPERMERLYPFAGPCKTNDPKRFFRDNMTVGDLRKMATKGSFTPASDDAREYQVDMFHLDVGEGCEESCEVDFTDDDVA